ncbi:hypothetical protein FBU30_009216 [Linnemannia zychae]|nr:hypothetical protein FBU30_009216 [Linnemannia zychae]
MPGEVRQTHHLEQFQQQPPPPPPLVSAPPILPVLNSINRISRTYYSKEDQNVVYSARSPGISLYRQTEMRRESCEIIAAIGKRIGFTAQLLLHRFYMFNSVQDTGNEVVMACLFVSSKVEDTIKKLKDIMIATYIFRHPNATDWDTESSKQLAHQAWDIARDSYKIGVCLEYPPHTIAAGSIYLASKLLGEPFPDLIKGKPWMKALRTRSIDVEGALIS